MKKRIVIKHISIVGAGNVAHNLAVMFNQAGVTIDSIYSRELANAGKLSELVGATPIDDISHINSDSELILFAVKDDVIAEVSKSLSGSSQLMAHTSGSVEMKVFGELERQAVFYPLQTFSKNKEYNGLPFPICIETSEEDDLTLLKSLAKEIVGGANVYEIDSDQRRTLHVAAVFANNFSNYFYFIAEDILKERNLSFDILKPLIVETMAKIDERGPAVNQTGPAVRGDVKIISSHLDYLESNEDYKRLYKMVTDQIIKKF